MNEKARTWRLLIGAAAAGIAGVVGLAGATASADPVSPQPPPPAFATVTQTVTVMPTAAINPVASTATEPGAAALSQPLAAPAAAPVTLVPATSGTLTDYFKDKGVTLEPQTAQDFKALNIVLPMPPGWTQVPDPNVPNAFLVTADRAGGDGLYTSNAQVTVSKLVGDFDPKDAITHGYIDSQQLSGWQSTDASLADFNGFPSSIIEGTYRADDQTLNTSRRHIIAASGPDNYLVTLAVTTSLDEVVATASATDIIINGFKVAPPGPTTP
jgi:hypothetical protein